MVPEPQLWQDPVPAVDHKLIDERDIAGLKARLLDSGLSISQLVSTAWASASTFRGTDKRGGANGARIRLAPQKDWEVNKPAELAKVLQTLENVQKDFNTATGGKKVSLADLIVLGGCAAVEKAAKNGGQEIQVPFAPDAPMRRRTRRTSPPSPYSNRPPMDSATTSATAMTGPPKSCWSIEQLLTLSAPEMTVLVGGMRVLNTNTGFAQLGVFTKRREAGHQ